MTRPGKFFTSAPNLLTHTLISANLLAKYDWGGMSEMQAYCVKCRTKRDIKNPRAITFKNGRPATQGICPVCGTKIFRIGKA
jgi:hypothetical protein